MQKPKKVNSREKGKVGEREACKFLKQLGFKDARRTAQYRGSYISADVECPESLPNVHIEVKFGYSNMTVGTSLLHKACSQAKLESNGKPWVVLWKERNSRYWKMTCLTYDEHTYWTTSNMAGIKSLLLQKEANYAESEKET